MRWQSLLWLIILPGVILYPCLSFHLFEPDEGRYAQIPREMLLRGEWIVPYLQSEPYLDKPPLMYWLVMLSYSVFGIHDWSARLIPALAVHGCILLVYFFGTRRLGERIGFWGAMALAFMPGFVGMARLLLLDGVQTFLVTLAIFSFLEAIDIDRLRWRWWLLAALACGLGVLCKGPVILVLTLPVVLVYRWLSSAQWPISRYAWLAFGGIVVVIAAPWYVAICTRLPEFGYYFLWQHNLMRFLQPFDHNEPVWFYVPILLGCLLPAVLLLYPFLRFLFSTQPEQSQQRMPELGYLLLAGGWCIFFFSMSGSKLPTYILPALPPLALSFGVYLASSTWPRSIWTRSTLAGVYVFMAVGNYFLVPWYAHERSPMNNPHHLATICTPDVPVVCFPRPVDSVAFYLGRDDFRSYRSKNMAEMLQFLQEQDRTVVLFSHRHSLEQLASHLPEHMELTQQAPMGLCSMAIVEKR